MEPKTLKIDPSISQTQYGDVASGHQNMAQDAGQGVPGPANVALLTYSAQDYATTNGELYYDLENVGMPKRRCN
jgi:hypothetical protein